jgi:hypothetical protein
VKRHSAKTPALSIDAERDRLYAIAEQLGRDYAAFRARCRDLPYTGPELTEEEDKAITPAQFEEALRELELCMPLDALADLMEPRQ